MNHSSEVTLAKVENVWIFTHMWHNKLLEHSLHSLSQNTVFTV